MKLKQRIKYWWQRRTRGWSNDECWVMNMALMHWLNSRLVTYKEEASQIVDLTYHKFEHNNKICTQEELIDKLIYLTDKMTDENTMFDINEEHITEINNTKDEIFDILKKIYWTLWW